MNQADFKRFYQQHVDSVYRYLFFRVSMNREVAEDLTSEVFMKALKAFASYDPKISESAWIHTIARNHLKNYYRDKKITEDIDDFTLGYDGNRNEEELDEIRELRGNLAKLEKKDRQLLEMKYIQGFKYKEIGTILKKSTGAVRVEAHRALKKLKSLYASKTTTKSS